MKTDKQNIHNAYSSAEAESVFRRFQNTLPFRLLVRGFITATKYLPVRLLRMTGILFVFIFIFFNFRNYSAIRKNLSRIKPGLSAFTYSCMAFSVFRNYSYYLIDLLHVSHDIRRIKKYSVQISGMENIERANAQNKGIIFLTTHLGNWEIGALNLPSMNKEIHLVYSPDSSSLLEIQRRLLRTAEGIREVPLKQGEFSSLKLLRLLQEEKIIALQGDRLLFDRGIMTKFFGHKALLPKGPIKLAMASDSIVLPVFMPITGFKSYEIIMEKPVIMEKTDDPDADLKTNLEKIIKILEKYIGLYPTQWYTFMLFWEEDRKGLTGK